MVETDPRSSDRIYKDAVTVLGSAVKAGPIAPGECRGICSAQAPVSDSSTSSTLLSQKPGAVFPPQHSWPAALGTSCTSGPRADLDHDPLSSLPSTPSPKHQPPGCSALHTGLSALTLACGVCLPHSSKGVLSGHWISSQPCPQP